MSGQSYMRVHRAETGPVKDAPIQEPEGNLSGRPVRRLEAPEQPVLPPQESPSIDDGSSSLLRKVTDFFISGEHPFKLKKYTQILDQYVLGLGGADSVSRFLSRLEGFNQKNQMVKHLTKAYRILAGRGNYKNDRARYQDLIKELRATIKCQQYQEIRKSPESQIGWKLAFCVRATKKLVQARWFKSEMYGYLKESTDLYMTHTPTSTHSSGRYQTFSDRFVEMNQKVKEAPIALKKSSVALGKQKLGGAVGIKDFSGTENVPFVRCRYHYRNAATGEERTIEYMRHSRPTVGGNALQFAGGVASRVFNSVTGSDGPSMHDGESIASDYEEAIQIAAERKEAIFYVVHQRRIPGGIENEADSTKLIENLDGKHANFHTLIQSVEGDLFEQKGKYAIDPTGESHKAALIDSFVNDKNPPNRLPNAVRGDREYHRFLGELYDQAFQTLFPERAQSEPLSADEWKEMTLFFYVMQKDDLKFRLSNDDYTVKYYTTPCKDFLDRGGNMAMVEDFVHYHMTEDGPTNKDRDHTLYTSLGTPVLVKKKEAILNRFIDGLRLVEKLERREHDKRALKGSRFHNWQFVQVEYPAH